MADWTSPSTINTDPRDPITSEFGTAALANPVAIAEGADGAPVLSTGWHGYNQRSVGDGNLGLIYDAAVDGSVSSVVSVDFEAGYEYAFYFSGIDSDSEFSANRNLRMEVFFDQAGAYSSAKSITVPFPILGERNYAGFFRIKVPQFPAFVHGIEWESDWGDANGAIESVNVNFTSSLQDTILRARLSLNVFTFDAGRIYQLRRREYFSG